MLTNCKHLFVRLATTRRTFWRIAAGKVRRKQKQQLANVLPSVNARYTK